MSSLQEVCGCADAYVAEGAEDVLQIRVRIHIVRQVVCLPLLDQNVVLEGKRVVFYFIGDAFVGEGYVEVNVSNTLG